MKKFLLLLAILGLGACTSPSAPEERPGDNGDAPDAEAEEIAAQISDHTMRIAGPLLSLSWNDPGILWEKTDDGTVGGRLLADGRDFEFNPGDELLPDGLLTRATLKVDGSRRPIDQAACMATTGGLWPVVHYRVITANPDAAADTTWIVIDHSIF